MERLYFRKAYIQGLMHALPSLHDLTGGPDPMFGNYCIVYEWGSCGLGGYLIRVILHKGIWAECSEE